MCKKKLEPKDHVTIGKCCISPRVASQKLPMEQWDSSRRDFAFKFRSKQTVASVERSPQILRRQIGTIFRVTPTCGEQYGYVEIQRTPFLVPEPPTRGRGAAQQKNLEKCCGPPKYQPLVSYGRRNMTIFASDSKNIFNHTLGLMFRLVWKSASTR